MFWVFFCACCREKASTFCELYCRKDAAFHLKDFWTVAHVICVVAGGQGCRWKPKTIRWSSGNEAGEPHTRTVLRAPVYAAEDNLGDLGSPDLLPWLQGSTWQLRGQWGPNPAHLSLVAYMFAGWGDEAKPVCVLKEPAACWSPDGFLHRGRCLVVLITCVTGTSTDTEWGDCCALDKNPWRNVQCLTTRTQWRWGESLFSRHTGVITHPPLALGMSPELVSLQPPGLKTSQNSVNCSSAMSSSHQPQCFWSALRG